MDVEAFIDPIITDLVRLAAEIRILASHLMEWENCSKLPDTR